MVALNGQTSAEEARAGSYTSLVVRLRLGEDLAKEERDFLADLLEGKFKLAPHRPKSTNLEYQQASLASFVDYFEKGYQTDPVTGDTTLLPRSNKAAVSLTMEEFGVSESTVRKALAAVKARRKNGAE